MLNAFPGLTPDSGKGLGTIQKDLSCSLWPKTKTGVPYQSPAPLSEQSLRSLPETRKILFLSTTLPGLYPTLCRGLEIRYIPCPA